MLNKFDISLEPFGLTHFVLSMSNIIKYWSFGIYFSQILEISLKYSRVSVFFYHLREFIKLSECVCGFV